MTGRDLVPGENAPLTADLVQLTVSPSSVPLVMVLLTADDRLHGTIGPAGHPGVIPVAGTPLPVTLSALDPAVDRCLLVGHGTGAGSAAVQLADGADQLRFSPTVAVPGTVVVLVEFYRRGAGWKVRAIGQGYPGGLPELGRVYGAELPSMAGLGSPPSPDPGSDRSAADRVLRHVFGVWEDAARSALTFAESVRFAESGRDAVLEQLVADVAGRSSDHPARQAAEQKYRSVMDAASQRRLADLDQLATELAELEAGFPAPLARWDAPAWQQPIPGEATGIFRVGEISRPDSQLLRIPMVQALGVPGGICLITPGNLIEQSTVTLLHRIFAAAPAGRSAQVVAIDDQLAGILGLPAASGSTQRAERLAAIALQIDLCAMAAESGTTPSPEGLPSVLVVPWQSTGFTEEEVSQLDTIAVGGPQFGLQVVYVGDQQEFGQTGLRFEPRYLPTVSAHAQDPWTSQVWDFEPDTGAPGPALAQRLRDRMGLSI